MSIATEFSEGDLLAQELHTVTAESRVLQQQLDEFRAQVETPKEFMLSPPSPEAAFLLLQCLLRLLRG